MPDVIVNTSPLQYLFQFGLLELLPIPVLCAGLLWAGQITTGETGFDLLTLAERAWLAAHPIAIRISL